MSRFAWLLFAHLLLLLSPRPAPVHAAFQGAPPTTPGNFAGVAQSTTSIQWSWSPSTGSSIITYEIHADPETSPPTVIATNLSATQYLESGLSENTPYRRHVHAKGSDGSMSPPSSPDRRYTLIHTATIGDFTVTLSSDTSAQINVVLPPNAFADQTGVEIYRTVPTFLQITPFSQVYTGSESNLSPNTDYGYNIQFRNGDAIPSGPSSPNTVHTPDQHGNCRWDISIRTSYGHADFVLNQTLTGVFPTSRGGSGPPRHFPFGSNHAELFQKGTITDHSLQMHRKSIGSAILDNPSVNQYSVLDAFSETVATITYTGTGTSHLNANMGCSVDLECHGHNTGILGGAGWALALVAQQQGQGDVSYEVPPSFLATDNGGAEGVFVGGDIGPFFGGIDIKLPHEHHPSPKHLRDAATVSKSKTQYDFIYKNKGGISAEISPSSSGVVQTEGSSKYRHNISQLLGSDGRCTISVTMNGDKANVTIKDDQGTRSFTLVSPPALRAPGPDPNFQGGQVVWAQGD